MGGLDSTGLSLRFSFSFDEFSFKYNVEIACQSFISFGEGKRHVHRTSFFLSTEIVVVLRQ